jgi:hypothetical protein
MRNKKNKILISVLIVLLIIGLVVVFRHYSSVKSLLLAEKELKEEIKKLKEAGILTTVEELNLPEIPDEKNGALVYKEIFKLKDSLNEKYKELIDYSPHRSIHTRWEEVPEEKKKEVIEFILHNSEFAELYEMLEKASRMECRFSSDEEYENGVYQVTEELQQLRDCARDLADKARIEREYGDINKSLNASLVGLRISKSLANEPTIVHQLVRFALDDIALRELEEAINKEGGNLELYKAFIDEIEKERTPHIIHLALKRGLVYSTLPFFSHYRELGEKVFELTEEQKQIETYPHGEDTLRQIKDQKQALKNVYLKSGCRTPEEFFTKEEIFSLKTKAKVIPLTAKPYWQVSKELEEIDAKIENLQDKGLLSNIFSSYYQRMYMSEAIYDARLGLAEIALANKIYKQKHEEYVDSLSQLTPDILSVLPLDPFTGEDYIYKKKDKGFIVYSLGKNMKDDNGTKRIYKKDSPAYENYDIVWECNI